MDLRWLLPLLVTMTLSGCVSDDEPPAGSGLGPAPQATITGQVLTPAFNPIPDVEVTLRQPSQVPADPDDPPTETVLSARTDGDGKYRIEGAWVGNHNLSLSHPDFEATQGRVLVDIGGVSANFTMTPISRIVPFQAMWPFKGYFQCGADHLIFAGSCDEFAGAVVDPVDGTLSSEREFFFDVEDDWKTIVIDIGAFQVPPTLDSLRLAAYSPQADAEVLTYERYAVASGSEGFTLRIEPGVDYGEALPAPEGPATIRLEVFPQGHAYKEVCDPTGSQPCFTGVGVSGRVDFEMIASVFYHEAAPEDFTLLG